MGIYRGGANISGAQWGIQGGPRLRNIEERTLLQLIQQMRWRKRINWEEFDDIWNNPIYILVQTISPQLFSIQELQRLIPRLRSRAIAETMEFFDVDYLPSYGMALLHVPVGVADFVREYIPSGRYKISFNTDVE